MKAIFPLIVILSCSLSQAQEQKRIVLDLETSMPVSYATIKVLHKSKGAIASEKGEFDLSIDAADSVLFTCVGYKSKTIAGKDITAITYLEPRAKTLEKVTVHTKNILRTLVLGYDTSRFNNDLNWGPGSKAEFAQRMDFPDINRSYKLRKIFIRIKKHSCYGPLLLHIYDTDTYTGNPGEEILTKPIYFNKSTIKKNKATIDVSEDNLYWQGDKSFFVSFSWMPEAMEQNCLTTIFFLQSSNRSTFTRSIMSDNYNWLPFYWGKDRAGNPSHATTFFSVEVDEIN
jgi:hypothetical protein